VVALLTGIAGVAQLLFQGVAFNAKRSTWVGRFLWSVLDQSESL
jgi:hypothetical protein